MQDVKTAELPAEMRDLNKPNLVALSYALRHPEIWPEGFIWGYNDCRTCALGLAFKLWNDLSISGHLGKDWKKAYVSWAARTFAMPYTEAEMVFMGKGEWTKIYETRGWVFKRQVSRQRCFKDVTPEEVADQIDGYLERAE